MHVIGATNGLPTGEWTVMSRSITRWGRQLAVNNETVVNVGHIAAGKGEYNYAAGGVGMFAGAALFGPAGLVVGGLLPKAFKGSVVEFAIQFTDGTVMRAKGKPSEYESLVKWSMEDPGAGVLNKMAAAAAAAAERQQELRGIGTDEDRERLRAELAAEKAAKKSPEAKAERKARIKEVQQSKLPYREKVRLIREIQDEY